MNKIIGPGYNSENRMQKTERVLLFDILSNLVDIIYKV